MSKLVKDRKVIYSERPPYPHNMLVELTNTCNHKCIFCAHKTMKRRMGFCDKDVMLNIICQAYKLGTREIGFYLCGETLLSKDLEFFVGQCKKLGFEYIYLTTNGALADKERIRGLCNLGLSSIKFSIDAATAKTHEKLHGRDDFDLVKKNLFDVLSLKDEGIDLGVFASFCVLKSNENEVSKFRKEIGQYLDDTNIELAFEQGGGTPDLVNELLDPSKRFGMAPCEMVFNRFHVTYEGYLTACCADMDNMLAYADLNEETLEKAWYNETITNLRREHLSGKLRNNKCYNCIFQNGRNDLLPLNVKLSNWK